MSTKQCSSCGHHRSIDSYSGAQLKKKGKRVCTPCITGEPTQESVDTSSGTVPSDSTLFDAEPIPMPRPIGSIVPDVKPEFLPEGTYPPNPIFLTPPVAYETGLGHGKGVAFYTYSSEEKQLALMTKLIERDLSEPYSVFTYRYFVNFWPHLTFMAMVDSECIGCIICRLVIDKQGMARGYIAMLAVSTLYRNCQIGSRLVKLVIEAMKAAGADLVVLEAEVTNKGALALYEKLNFVRETRLVKYYLSGSDAFRLKLWLKPLAPHQELQQVRVGGPPPPPQDEAKIE